jgi:hypothetical protein
MTHQSAAWNSLEESSEIRRVFAAGIIHDAFTATKRGNQAI